MVSFLSLLIFLVLHLGSSIYSSVSGNTLYHISPVVCILPALLFAVSFSKSKIQDSINTIVEGVGNKSTITMCLIFLFSGAFATVTQSIGSADVVTDLILKFLPASLLLPGIFLVSAFISTAIGTSMGVVALVTPIVISLAKSGIFGIEIGVATVISGAMFGDNLSIISDTTVVSVSSQGASTMEKLKLNFKVAFIAGVITLICLVFASNNKEITSVPYSDYLSIIKIIPYISLVIMGFYEINALATLVVNIIIAGILGMTFFDYSVVQYSHDIYKGFSKVNEIMIFALLIGGLSNLMYKQSKEKLSNFIDNLNVTKTKAEFLIAGMSSIFTILVANNTIAILLGGDIAKKLAQKYNIAPHRSAYLLDTFACITKGILPYGSQLLLAGSIASLSPIAFLTKIYYCFFLAAVAICEIIFNNRKRFFLSTCTDTLNK
ncbi:MAG: Na+/H+ antiporter NhaC family protein [Wolbachia endosymbiont of Tyrophagus putrescentiae]|nr:Na+/H+ antiporter NhaC family protein [Wolbachia endosymbiont of Tyrophagus putrescentiae]